MNTITPVRLNVLQPKLSPSPNDCTVFLSPKKETVAITSAPNSRRVSCTIDTIAKSMYRLSLETEATSTFQVLREKRKTWTDKTKKTASRLKEPPPVLEQKKTAHSYKGIRDHEILTALQQIDDVAQQKVFLRSCDATKISHWIQSALHDSIVLHGEPPFHETPLGSMWKVCFPLFSKTLDKETLRIAAILFPAPILQDLVRNGCIKSDFPITTRTLTDERTTPCEKDYTEETKQQTAYTLIHEALFSQEKSSEKQKRAKAFASYLHEAEAYHIKLQGSCLTYDTLLLWHNIVFDFTHRLVLFSYTHEEREKAVTFLLETASACLENNDLLSAEALISAFSSPALSRLYIVQSCEKKIQSTQVLLKEKSAKKSSLSSLPTLRDLHVEISSIILDLLLPSENCMPRITSSPITSSPHRSTGGSERAFREIAYGFGYTKGADWLAISMYVEPDKYKPTALPLFMRIGRKFEAIMKIYVRQFLSRSPAVRDWYMIVRSLVASMALKKALCTHLDGYAIDARLLASIEKGRKNFQSFSKNAQTLKGWITDQDSSAYISEQSFVMTELIQTAFKEIPSIEGRERFVDTIVSHIETSYDTKKQLEVKAQLALIENAANTLSSYIPPRGRNHNSYRLQVKTMLASSGKLSYAVSLILRISFQGQSAHQVICNSSLMTFLPEELSNDDVQRARFYYIADSYTPKSIFFSGQSLTSHLRGLKNMSSDILGGEKLYQDKASCLIAGIEELLDKATLSTSEVGALERLRRSDGILALTSRRFVQKLHECIQKAKDIT